MRKLAGSFKKFSIFYIPTETASTACPRILKFQGGKREDQVQSGVFGRHHEIEVPSGRGKIHPLQFAFLSQDYRSSTAKTQGRAQRKLVEEERLQRG